MLKLKKRLLIEPVKLVIQLPNKHCSYFVGNLITCIWVDNLYNNTNHKLSEFSVTEMCKLDELQIFGLLGLLGQLPTLSPLREHDCELEVYKQ